MVRLVVLVLAHATEINVLAWKAVLEATTIPPSHSPTHPDPQHFDLVLLILTVWFSLSYGSQE